MTGILTITVNPALDFSTEAPAVIPDQKLRCSSPEIHPGGGGVNVSRAIANLGGQSRPLLAYGGPTGDMLAELLKEEGLRPEPLGVSYSTRQSVSVRDGANGLQYRFMLPGHDWSEADVSTARETIEGAIEPGDLVIPSGSFPPGLDEDFFLNLAPVVAARGGRMILDTSGAALEHACQTPSEIYVLRMDLAEAREASQRSLVGLEDIATLASEFREKSGAEIVMIAAGATGNVICCDAWRGLTRPPVVVPISAIGAGDSFIGAFAMSLVRGEDPVTACSWGTAAAASAVTRGGTVLCDRPETEAFFQQVTRVEL
ncbi:MAG: 1-phosphofructokinase family hexose kinase [Pseudomonadota bacterium]